MEAPNESAVSPARPRSATPLLLQALPPGPARPQSRTNSFKGPRAGFGFVTYTLPESALFEHGLQYPVYSWLSPSVFMGMVHLEPP